MCQEHWRRGGSPTREPPVGGGVQGRVAVRSGEAVDQAPIPWLWPQRVQAQLVTPCWPALAPRGQLTFKTLLELRYLSRQLQLSEFQRLPHAQEHAVRDTRVKHAGPDLVNGFAYQLAQGGGVLQ